MQKQVLQLEILSATSQFLSSSASLLPVWDTFHLTPGLTFLICVALMGMHGGNNKYIYSSFQYQSLRLNECTNPQTHKITLVILD